MSQIVWNEDTNRIFETGVSKGVLYRKVNGAYPKGVAWDGLISVTESPSGAEPTKLYASNTVHAIVMSREEYAATIEAYQSPEEFDECDGTVAVVPGAKIGQQPRTPFGLSYVSQIGDSNGNIDHGYKIHILYGGLAAPSERAHNTINEEIEAETLSWEISTTPVNVKGHKPTATFELDSTTLDAEKLAAIEAILYGTEDAEPRLPLPDELLTLLGVNEEEAAG